jgi:Holliday junction resolvase
MSMSRKRIGSEAERELCHIFIKHGYRVIRTAGSGTLNNADCDLIVANKKKNYCIEVKSTRKKGIYIPKDRVKELIIFSEDTNFKPVIALRFLREKWIFINPNQLKDTGSTLSITFNRAKKEGRLFEEYFK